MWGPEQILCCAITVAGLLGSCMPGPVIAPAMCLSACPRDVSALLMGQGRGLVSSGSLPKPQM